jgi:peptidoglycan/xylan/chitin deacetylase (PgdA/CDA1 family)
MGSKNQQQKNIIFKNAWLPALATIVILIVSYSLYILINARTFQLFGGLTDSVQTNEKIVALTFDDGPSPGATEEIIDILDRNNVKATFFLMGSSIDKNLSQTKKLIEAGHQIGNHSYTHPRLVLTLPNKVESEVNKTNNAIRNAGYKGEIMFRPPYGKKFVYLPYYVNKIGMKTIMWNIEPESYENNYGNTEAIVSNVSGSASPGSIIILHAMNDRVATRKAIGPIINNLKADGYKFVTVEQLLNSEKK